MQIDEIIALRMKKQFLLSLVPDEHSALQHLCGLQSQFYGNALHALYIRCGRKPDEPLLLRTAAKTWTLRGTLHLIARDDLPLFLHEGHTHFLRPCDTMEDDEQLSAARKKVLAAHIVEACAAGHGEREELRTVCREAGMTAQEEQSAFNAWGGLLRALCENGMLVHAAQQEKAFLPCPPFSPMPEEDAKRELLRRYLCAYGPATIKDMSYFFSSPQRTLLPVLESLSPAKFNCEGKPFYSLCDNSSIDDFRCCRFLAGFDPLMLGYEKKESLFLPAHALRAIFSLSGIVRPAILLDGRVVGFWKRSGKSLLLTGLEPLQAPQRKRIEEEAELLWGDALKKISWAE